ncbi:hypothetical protein [Abditibacterium utsteinense]|uniref:hypothetical protein n=1 Tax=Abditibacterium utsteinense TaxID=1960156 RepID=UPI001300441D|nr:hypothetical protein [Abditibacterium utsteinense]
MARFPCKAFALRKKSSATKNQTIEVIEKRVEFGEHCVSTTGQSGTARLETPN